jgi:TetR/AcrR family transcriptional regulator, fatty acid metabolism regulator protein
MEIKKNKRQLQAEETKEKIFNIAIEEFKNKGYENVTIQDICTKCGISKGTFYVHYISKDDIVRKSYRQSYDEYLLKELELYNQEYPNATPVERLYTYLYKSINFTNVVGAELTKRAFIVNISSFISGPDNIVEQSTILPELANIVEEGIDLGIFDQSLTKWQLMGLINSFISGSMLQWIYHNTSYDIMQLCAVHIPHLISGILEKNHMSASEISL